MAREIQIHSGLVHDHIIALYGAFEDGKHVYLVQEFAPGTSRSLHRNRGRLCCWPICAPVCHYLSARVTPERCRGQCLSPGCCPRGSRHTRLDLR